MRLTERQAEIYAFIQQQFVSNQRMPTTREIGKAFDIVSPNGVACHLHALERKGLIERGRQWSSIKLCGYTVKLVKTA